MTQPAHAASALPIAQEQKRIIITGFGPFVGHETVNASWEAVRLLPDTLDFRGTMYVLEKQMIQVEYAAVDAAVDSIANAAPVLVIHCGVHSSASCIHVEKLAYNHKFTRSDYAGKRLSQPSACLTNCSSDSDVINCGLNVDKIVAKIEESCDHCAPNMLGDELIAAQMQGAVAIASTDVGNYLCGYIYLKSLDRNPNRTLFVHVPPIDQTFSSAKTAEVILKIAEECIRQLVEDLPETC